MKRGKWMAAIGRAVGLVILGAICAVAQDVKIGDTADQVRQELGRPRSRYEKDGVTYLHYDQGSVTLEDGRVTQTNLVSESVAEAARAQHEREAEARRAEAEQSRAARRTSLATTPAAATTSVAAGASQATHQTVRQGAATGMDEAARASAIADVEARIAAITNRTAAAGSKSSRESPELWRLRAKLDVLHDDLAMSSSGVTQRIAEVETQIDSAGKMSTNSKSDSKLQELELRRLKLKLEMLREQQQALPATAQTAM